MSSNNDVVTPSERFTGRVKWFNSKAGFGFITVTDGDKSGSDVFVHHSAVEVENQQYKYLVQGEYVEFELVKSSGESHEWQASSVHGIKGGKLMCETRREFKLARASYKTTNEGDQVEPRQQRAPREPRDSSGPRQQRAPREPRDSSGPRQQRAPRARGEGPRDESSGDKKEWTMVKPKAQGRGRPPRQNSETK
jgi:CspA family cold shock protein